MQVRLLVRTVTINYRIILLMMLFITSWCKPLKTDPSRETCIYTTCYKSFLPNKHPDKLIYICYCCWSAWLNGWMFIYELSGSGFESSCSHLNFRYRACFEQGDPWHSCNYIVWIHSETCSWHDKNMQLVEPCHKGNLYFQDGWNHISRSMVKTKIYYNLLHDNVFSFGKSSKAYQIQSINHQ